MCCEKTVKVALDQSAVAFPQVSQSNDNVLSYIPGLNSLRSLKHLNAFYDTGLPEPS